MSFRDQIETVLTKHIKDITCPECETGINVDEVVENWDELLNDLEYLFEVFGRESADEPPEKEDEPSTEDIEEVELS